MLAIENLHTYYGEAHILQGVSLSIAEGEIATIIGRNGAGKTTLLRSIMGVVRPARGTPGAISPAASSRCSSSRARWWRGRASCWSTSRPRGFRRSSCRP
jgi:ABC-type Mn2+/Zn2+ transport system ATPase subunit